MIAYRLAHQAYHRRTKMSDKLLFLLLLTITSAIKVVEANCFPLMGVFRCALVLIIAPLPNLSAGNLDVSQKSAGGELRGQTKSLQKAVKIANRKGKDHKAEQL